MTNAFKSTWVDEKNVAFDIRFDYVMFGTTLHELYTAFLANDHQPAQFLCSYITKFSATELFVELLFPLVNW